MFVCMSSSCVSANVEGDVEILVQKSSSCVTTADVEGDVGILVHKSPSCVVADVAVGGVRFRHIGF